jgi:DNA-directed RNA polymerase specialized sigma54-like protein
MDDGRKSATLELVRVSTGREPRDLVHELYVEKRHSDQEIADALTATTGYPIGRATVNEWRRRFGITRDDRPAVAL